MSYILGDGIKALKKMRAKSIDGIFSDPPWGGAVPIMGNEHPMELMKSLDDECPRILKPGGRVLLWVGARQIGDFIRVFKNLEYRWLILCRYVPARYIIRFQSQFDPILYLALPGEPYPYPEKSLPQCYLKVSTGKKDSDHPCARPAEVVQSILRDWFKPGETIVDPFAGSDTTGYACRQIGLKCRSYELDPQMFITGLARNSQELLFEKKKGG